MNNYTKGWRVLENINSNDNNNCLDYTIVPYRVDRRHNLMSRNGFNNWNPITDDIIFDRGLAEEELVCRCTRDLRNELKEVRKQICDEIREKAKGLSYTDYDLDERAVLLDTLQDILDETKSGEK